MGLFKNLTKTIGKIAPIAIPAMMGFGFGGGAAGGIGSFFSGLSGGSKLGLGLGALALAGGLGRRQEYGFEERPEPVGKNFAITSRLRDGTIVQLTDPDQLKQYRDEIQTQPNPNDYIVPVSDINLTGEKVGIAAMYHGGEVEGPGTGTSDSVPARLSDGEFVMTAAAVRGAGDGDRDIGAARMYDMMAELEAQA
jgi:hypothetical protein|tara:strand:+ start:890 stop:1474 length:585 start_codon:yes stop_codon:yes gene_type:complete